MTSISEHPTTGVPPLRRDRRALLAAGGALMLGGRVAWAQAGRARPAPAVLPFGVDTWQRLQAKGPRPAAYLFSATYCPSCPGAFDALRAHVLSAGRPAELAVVLVDVQGAQAQRHLRHYAGATRFYAFDGFESAIRQSVDAQWPNVTPYVVLLGRDGSVRRSIGAPGQDMLQQWL